MKVQVKEAKSGLYGRCGGRLNQAGQYPVLYREHDLQGVLNLV